MDDQTLYDRLKRIRDRNDRFLTKTKGRVTEDGGAIKTIAWTIAEIEKMMAACDRSDRDP